jgi:hypothetical protein
MIDADDGKMAETRHALSHIPGAVCPSDRSSSLLLCRLLALQQSVCRLLALQQSVCCLLPYSASYSVYIDPVVGLVAGVAGRSVAAVAWAAVVLALAYVVCRALQRRRVFLRV